METPLRSETNFMSARFTIVLVVLLILIGGLVAVTQVLRTSDDVPDRQDRLYRISSDEISSVTLGQGDNKITFVKLEGRWQFQGQEEDKLVQVDVGRWGGIPALLGGPAVATNLSESDEELGTRAYYGIDPPWSRINITSFDGQTIEVNVGDKTPTDDGYYAQVTGSEILYIVHASWADVIMRLLTEPPYPAEQSSD